MSDGSTSGTVLPSLLSHYRLERLLGRGSMGAVYYGVDRRDELPVAVKLINPEVAGDEAFRERFIREAHVAALLRSPYTVHLTDYGAEQGRYFLVMEYIEGQTLEEAMAAGAIEPVRALRIAAQVAHAMEEAQARGVVHRDIKPANILLTTEGRVKVTDFGVARQTFSPSTTIPGSFVGTAHYAAPEIANGEADARSDVYSLGATLFHMLRGAPLFDGGFGEVLRAHRELPPPLDELRALSPALAGVLGRCLAKRPEDRFQSASELAGALERTAEALARPNSPAATVSGRASTETRVAPAGTAGAPLRLSLQESRRTKSGSVYDLVVSNPGPLPRRVSLTAAEGADRCFITVPPCSKSRPAPTSTRAWMSALATASAAEWSRSPSPLLTA